MSPTRIVLGAAGVALGLFGVFRLVTEIPLDDLTLLAFWLAAAVLLHDGVLSPLLVGIGWLLARFVPPRARGHLQAALIVGGLITVIALPMIHRQDTQPPSKAVLRQDYGGNLAIVLAIVAAVVLVSYVVRLLRPAAPAASSAASRPASSANDRPDTDHDSTST